jgi:hypothetical protein
MKRRVRFCSAASSGAMLKSIWLSIELLFAPS